MFFIMQRISDTFHIFDWFFKKNQLFFFLPDGSFLKVGMYSSLENISGIPLRTFVNQLIVNLYGVRYRLPVQLNHFAR